MTNKWRIFNKITWERDGSSFILANGELYILGGHDENNKSLNTVEKSSNLNIINKTFIHVPFQAHKYNFVTIGLKEISPMKMERCCFGTAILNNSIYVAGGLADGKEINYVER